MLPNQLTIENFDAYPSEAKRQVASQLGLLRRMPLAFVSLLLRELIVYDWKFPAERRDLDRQFAYLAALSPEQFSKAMQAFAALHLTPALEKTDWINAPGGFSEQLSAHLWATHQIDSFRAAAINYVAAAGAISPEDALPTHRLVIVVIGQGVGESQYRLFRKLRPQGTYFTQVKQANGLSLILAAVGQRADTHPLPYGHWYIDGSAPLQGVPGNIAHVSYASLSPARAALQSRMQKIYEASVFDPEAFRTRMAQTRPAEIGLDSGSDAVLNRFQLSLLTEGSGTQIFATTFVQWAAREALRRAQPVTLVARFGPRQRENPMNELLAEAQHQPELDPQGSLIDADNGAYYTWLNQQRLSFPDKAAFLVWFEDHREAVAIGPGLERGKRSDQPIGLRDLVAQLA